ncbi:aromatic amino acid aminotransferase [Jannaschia pagri]|uniref:Aromatic amino acid aminotransferase n=1 Tax=Jannaschia pagri TaxID=2829797 RepID=A0ABQ4NKL5_9RHOB|nr:MULTISPECIES: amino acid aminotransferase [unclassified Jannaschia]GIT91123.1 aromatic amino acid aminotransferase [Jannaschia sp. AI_61]GIT94955.1 aromatic amino acid aminotransferase [Jannaschia sp. AI_62]
MLTALTPQAPDKILALMAAFREDPRPGKIDLGVGVYKDASGLTPVMRAVKAAERQLVEEQDTKAYTGLAGDPAYADALSDLVLGDARPEGRLAAVATPGGTGAIRQGLELIRLATPEARVWMSNPTWPNHPAIVGYLGMPTASYRYFDDDTRGVDFDGMVEDLAGVAAGDAVILHGCCHNPTGANLTLDQWRTIADLLADRGAVPFVDIAYQGFGDGLEADAEATRLILQSVPEAIIAASCSKNFGIYRERTGLLMAMAPSADHLKVTQGAMASLNRLNFSFPPDHGARVVTMILTDDTLRADWAAELEEVRLGMLGLREALATALRDRVGSDRFGFLAAHRGMFSRLGATPEQVEAMRRDHGVYMVGDSRLNIAGLNAQTVPILADAIVAAGV